MTINTNLQQQRPFAWSAAVRSVPSPRAGTRLDAQAEPKPVAAEEKSFGPRLER
jgi:hypothetical protein